MNFVFFLVFFVFFCQLFVTLANVINCGHEPPSGTPSFIRSSVESVPEVTGQRNEALISSVYGETSLPLRSAVESIPSISYVETFSGDLFF